MSIFSYWTQTHLRGRTLLIAVSGVCAILLLIGISDYTILRESIQERMQERLMVAKMVAVNLERLITQNLTDLQNFSFYRGVNLQDGDWEAEKSALHDIALHSMCSSVFLLDAKGKLVWSEPINHQRMIDRPSLQEAISTGKPLVSNLLAGERRVVLLFVPLYQNTSPIGFVGGELDPTRPEFIHILEHAKFGMTGFVEIRDSKGEILVSTRKDQSSEKIQQMVAAYPLAEIPWSIFISQSKNEALGALHRMGKRFLTFGVALLIVTFLITWGISQSVILPVQSLTNSAKRIASGDLEHPIPFTGSDEIGKLGNTLDEMRVKLKDSMEEVRLMNVDLGQRVKERTKEVIDLYEELKRKEEVRSDLLRKILSAQEEERKRIARELHDQLSQKLTALLFTLDSNNRHPNTEKIRDLTVTSIDSVHQLIFDLRPAVLDDLGLPAAIRWYAEERLNPRAIKIHFENELNSHPLGNELKTVLFRIAQETISNIARHSKAENVLIAIETENDFIKLDIEDDGIGFNPDEFKEPKYKMRGLGLCGMKERASLLNGTLQIESEPKNGTRVLARFPYHELKNDG